MACAHAKFTGEVGVCLATSGPGAIHLLNGLYDAKLDHQPVVAIVGQQARDVARRRATSRRSTSSRCSRTSRASTCRWRSAPAQVTHLIDRAVRIALGDALGHLRDRPRPTCRRRRSRTPPRAHGAVFSGRADARAAGAARSDADLRRAAEVLNAGEQGRDARRRRAPARPPTRSIEVAERLGAGVAKALNGRDVLPDDLPFVTGSIGLLGTKPSDEMMQQLRHAADGRLRLPLLRVAARAGPGARRADRHRRADARHPLPDGGQPRRRRRATRCARCCRCSSARPTAAGRERDRGRRSSAGGGCSPSAAEVAAEPLNPQRVFHELSPRLPDDVHRHRRLGLGHQLVRAPPALPPRDARRALGHAGHDGPGAALRAGREVRPPRPPGDRDRRRRGDADERHQRADRRRASTATAGATRASSCSCSTTATSTRSPGSSGCWRATRSSPPRRCIPDFPYAALRRAARLRGHPRRRARTQVAPAWDGRWPPTGRCVLEAVVDPEVPPLPPHIRFEQAKELAQALAKGDPARGRSSASR